jgi:hypothetical protein
MGSLKENVYYNVGGGKHWRMIDGVFADNRLHTLGLEMLGLRGNHPIIFGDEKPHRLVLPKWSRGFLLNALPR